MRASRESEKNKEKVTFYHVRKKGKLRLVSYLVFRYCVRAMLTLFKEAEVSGWRLDILE